MTSHDDAMRCFRNSLLSMDLNQFDEVVQRLDREIFYCLSLDVDAFEHLYRSLTAVELLELRQFCESERQARLRDLANVDRSDAPAPLWR